MAPFAYHGPVRRLIVAAKYRTARAGLGWLAGCIAHAVRTGEAAPTVDVVTWVPADPHRRRRRGFDQAQLMARMVGADLGLPVRGLLRRRGRRPQTGSTMVERVQGPALVTLARVDGRGVLVVDDVATTGASLARAAGALRAAGAIVVVGATGARTPRDVFPVAG